MSNRYCLNKTKYLSDAEVVALEKSLDGTRDGLLIRLGLETGARATELLNITVSDLGEGTVLIRGLKGSNDREIPLQPELFSLLRGLLPGKGGRLFPISYPRLYQIWQMWRPVGKKFHSLRHTFAIRLYKRHRDLRLLQVALGHRSIGNTMIYADYVYSQGELRRLIL